MATNPIEGSAIAAFPAIAPMPAVARILARFERNQLAGFIAVAIDLLDTLDGDIDLQESGDCEDEVFTETARRYAATLGAGCPIGDPGGCQHDGREEDQGDY